MDHSDKIKQNLQLLRLENLEGLSLGQLSSAIGERLPSDVSKKRILNIYVMWLHPRLMAIDFPTDEAFTHEIAAWYRFLKALPSDDNSIAEAFWDWQHGQSVQDPASWKRLKIAEAQLHKLMSPSPTKLELSVRYGHMHPDRLKLSEESPAVIELDDGDSDIVVVSSNTLRIDANSPENHGRNGQRDLSFLTGSNMLAVNETAKAPRRKNADISQAQGKPVTQLSRSRETEETCTPKELLAGYICHRCGKEGKHNRRDWQSQR